MHDQASDARPVAFGTLFVVAQHLDRLGDVALAPLGLTTKQWLLLAVVQQAFAGRPPTLTEAAAVYGSSRQNVKGIAHGLEAAGYLRLVRDPSDRRATRLALTDKVDEFATLGWRAREAAFFAFAFGSLEPPEVAQLAGLLQRWLAGIASRPPDAGTAATGTASPAVPAAPPDGTPR